MLEHFSVLLLLLLPLILYHKGFRVPLSLLGITPDVYVVSPNSQVVRKGKGYTHRKQRHMRSRGPRPLSPPCSFSLRVSLAIIGQSTDRKEGGKQARFELNDIGMDVLGRGRERECTVTHR